MILIAKQIPSTAILSSEMPVVTNFSSCTSNNKTATAAVASTEFPTITRAS